MIKKAPVLIASILASTALSGAAVAPAQAGVSEYLECADALSINVFKRKCEGRNYYPIPSQEILHNWCKDRL